jgi:hypothetical protein
LGISAYSVIDEIDLGKFTLPPDVVEDGSKIQIVEEGYMIIEACKKWKAGTKLTISLKGRLRRAKAGEKVYGEVQDISDKYAMIYFRKYGL